MKVIFAGSALKEYAAWGKIKPKNRRKNKRTYRGHLGKWS